jgi:hypothetical protein
MQFSEIDDPITQLLAKRLLTASDLENQKQETAVLPVAKPPLNSLTYFARANRTVRSLRNRSQQNLRQSPVTDWHLLQGHGASGKISCLNGRVGLGFAYTVHLHPQRMAAERLE